MEIFSDNLRELLSGCCLIKNRNPNDETLIQGYRYGSHDEKTTNQAIAYGINTTNIAIRYSFLLAKKYVYFLAIV